MIQTIFAQSLIHLLSYTAVFGLLIFALWQALVLRMLRGQLDGEAIRLCAGNLKHAELELMLHPLAKCLLRSLELPAGSLDALRRCVEFAEGELFVPLKARIVFCRDASTLGGLIATLLAIFSASQEFAQSGKSELLVGSVGNGIIATVIAAIACLLALANASTLAHLRLSVGMQCEELLIERLGTGVTEKAPISTQAVAKTEIASCVTQGTWFYVI